MVRVLVQCLVEEDNSSNAAVNAIISTEEDLTELTAVLLRVLHSHLGQALAHATWSRNITTASSDVDTVVWIWTTSLNVERVINRHSVSSQHKLAYSAIYWRQTCILDMEIWFQFD